MGSGSQFLVLLAVLTAACTPMVTIDDRGRTIEHHFGYMQVIKPPAKAPHERFRAEGIWTVGLTVSDGVGVGYMQRARVYIPLDCRIVVIVNNQTQLDHAVDMLSAIDGEDLCVTVSAD